MSDKYGFVYIWFNKIKKMYYIGSHWGTEDDGYVCSSNWCRNTYNRHPDDFKRRILSRIYTNRIDTFLEEERWLKMIKPEELKKRYYNISNSVKDHWIQYPEKQLSIRQKMSNAKKGKHPVKEWKKGNIPWNAGKKGLQIPWNKGIPHTEEAKQKMSESSKGQIAWNKGLPQSKKQKKEHSERMMGRIPWNKGKNKYLCGGKQKDKWKETNEELP